MKKGRRWGDVYLKRLILFRELVANAGETNSGGVLEQLNRN